MGWLFTLSLLLSGPSFASWQERVFDRESARILSVGAAGTLLAFAADAGQRELWRDHQIMSKDVALVGNYLGADLPGLTIALIQYTVDGPEYGRSHWNTWLGSAVVTTLLKNVVQRPRPCCEDNRKAWPSGHTSSAFASASALAYAYGPRVGLPALMAAGFVGASRMADDMHWFSDVVAGATIGIWMGYTFQQDPGRVVKSKFHNSWSVFPSIENESFFVRVLSQF